MVVKRFIDKCALKLPGAVSIDCFFLASGEAAQIRKNCMACGCTLSLVIGQSFDESVVYWFCKSQCDPERIWLLMTCFGLSEDDLYYTDRVKHLNFCYGQPDAQGVL